MINKWFMNKEYTPQETNTAVESTIQSGDINNTKFVVILKKMGFNPFVEYFLQIISVCSLDVNH